jgi:transcriptional regulator with XRE-family HTH domain
MQKRGIAESLKYWREVRGISQRDLADKAGVGFASIGRIETGRQDPTVGILTRLAKALNVTVAELIGEGKPARKRAGR